MQGRLDDLAARYGRYVIAERSVPMEPSTAATRVRQLLREPPTELAGHEVDEVVPFPAADLLRSCWPAASACRSVPAARNPRSSSTPKPSTSTPPPPSTPSRISFSSVFSSHQRTQTDGRTVSIAASAAAGRR